MKWNEKKRNENVQMEKNRGNKTITIKRRRKNSQESNKFGYFENHWICVLFVAKIPYKEADYIIITGFFLPFLFICFFFSLFTFWICFSLCYLAISVEWRPHLKCPNIKLSWDHINTLCVDSNYRPATALAACIHILTHLKIVQRKAKAI